MQRLLTLFFCFLGIFNVKSQKLFDYRVNSYDYVSNAWYSLQIDSTSVYIVGNLEYQPYIVKTDLSGNVIWSKEISSHQGLLKSITTNLDSNIVGCFVSLFNTDSILIFEMTPEGEMLWTNTQPTQIRFEVDKIISKANGEYLVMGGRETYPDYLVFVYTINKEGEIIDQFSYLIEDLHHPHDAYLNSKSELIISGTLFDGAFLTCLDLDGEIVWEWKTTGQPYDFNRDFDCNEKSILVASANDRIPSISKFSMQGELIWNKVISDEFNGYSSDVVITDTGYFVVGTNFSQVFMAKLDTNGNVIWDKTLDQLFSCYPSSVNKLSNNTFLVSNKVSHDPPLNRYSDFYAFNFSDSGEVGLFTGIG